MRNRAFAALALLALTLPFWDLGAPLLEVDDARYAQVPAEMLASGDWTVPTLNGLHYVEKPPLWYWLAAASYRVFGVSEAAARLPLALLALLGALGAWWLGAWLYSPAVGRLAGAATASALLWAFLAHNMTLDLPVSVFLFGTTAFSLRAMLRPEDGRWAAPAAWACAGLAFLSKGLISVLFPAAWVVGLVLLRPELRAGAAALLRPDGPLIAAAIVLPWLFAVSKAKPDFLQVFFVEQHFQRFLTPKYNRGAGWWFYLVVLPLGLLPWTVPAVAGFLRAAKRPFGGDARDFALACWIVGVAFFFSVSHSKLATYALPVVPFCAVLAARRLEDGLSPVARKSLSAIGWTLVAASALAALAVLASALPSKTLPPAAAPAALVAVAAVLVLGAVQVLAAKSPAPALPLLAGGVLAWGLALGALRAAEPFTSARALSLAVRDAAKPGDEVWTYGTYFHGLPFYSGRRVDRMVYFIGEFHYAKRDPANEARFGDDDEMRLLPLPGKTVFVAYRAFERPHLRTLPKEGSIVSDRDFGSWALAEVRAR
ncbi:MAG: glycosyltransferase family 39 protein [Elusimicrobiota bacterium]|nr:glycosyltransferase family 39 protein [Elusimicrobiota bacterium]